MRFILTAGQRHDITQAEALTNEFESEYVIADRSFDADDFVLFITEKDAIPVIPSRKNRIVPREYDTHLYKERAQVECFIGKIKHYRRIFSRFDKLASRFMGFLSFAAALIWLR